MLKKALNCALLPGAAMTAELAGAGSCASPRADAGAHADGGQLADQDGPGQLP